jgi:hypothetical protein
VRGSSTIRIAGEALHPVLLGRGRAAIAPRSDGHAVDVVDLATAFSYFDNLTEWLCGDPP